MIHQVRREFESTPEAIGEARVFLQTAIAGRVDAVVEGELALALSELATNAVRHAESPFEVVVDVNGHVRIEVEDHSTDTPVPKAPSADGGRGLVIVDQLCDRWGVHVARNKKCVWCERDLPDVEPRDRTGAPL